MLQYLQLVLANARSNEEGQTAVEYGLVLAVIAIVLVIALSAGLGNVITAIVNRVTDGIDGALGA